MKRMQTFFTYALIIILFWIFSSVASNLLLKNSYKSVASNKLIIEKANNGFEINVDRANSNKQQAYFTGTVKNASKKVIEKQYVKVESFYKGKFMQEKYLAFENMQPGEERKFKLLYEVGSIDEYRVSYVDEIPTNKTIIDDAIEAVKGYIQKAFNFLNGFSFNFGDVKEGAGNLVEGAKDAFEPVLVEGEAWQLLPVVLFIIYVMPSGFFFGLF